MEMIFNSNPVEGEFHYVDGNKKYQYRGGAWVVYTNNQPLAEMAAIPVTKPLVAATAPAFPQSNPFWQHELTGILYFQKVVDGVTTWDKVSTDTPPTGTLNADITGIAAYANKFYTPRNINGVAFDGSADIVVNAVDSTTRIASSEKGVADGVATLDSNGKVPSAQLPSYVDDVLEYTSQGTFPATGETGKIYVALDTNKTYRWSGSAYVFITSGAVDSVAGKTGAVVLETLTVGSGLSGTNYNGATASTLTVTYGSAANTAVQGNDARVTADQAATTASIRTLGTGALQAAPGNHTHPLQTTITGNAATATALETPRTINGVSFDGTANITINAVDSTARIAFSEKGAVNGVATLGADGKVPAGQLPSYVDDVLEYGNQAAFPATGETGKIYVALDTNKAYRWSGSTYVYITSGAVDSVAGKTGVVTLVKADVGLGNVDNTSDLNKPISNAVKAALDELIEPFLLMGV